MGAILASWQPSDDNQCSTCIDDSAADIDKVAHEKQKTCMCECELVTINLPGDKIFVGTLSPGNVDGSVFVSFRQWIDHHHELLRSC